MMNESSLYEKIISSYKSVVAPYELYLIYAGAADVETGEIIPFDRINKKNQCIHEALTHLMTAYGPAYSLRDFCDLYQTTFPWVSGSDLFCVRSIKKVADTIIDQGNVFIQNHLKQYHKLIPDSHTATFKKV